MIWNNKLVGLLFLFAAVACDNNNQSVNEDWDSNADARIDQDEFYTGFNREGFFNDWDENGDKILDQGEWEQGMTDAHPGYDNEVNIFRDWDLDGDQGVNKEEFANGSYLYWDEDQDGFLDANEYERYNSSDL